MRTWFTMRTWNANQTWKSTRGNQHVDQRSHRTSVLIARDTIGQRSCMRQLVSHYMKWLWLFRAVLFFKSGVLLRSFSRQLEPEKRWKKPLHEHPARRRNPSSMRSIQQVSSKKPASTYRVFERNVASHSQRKLIQIHKQIVLATIRLCYGYKNGSCLRKHNHGRNRNSNLRKKRY